MPKFLSDLPVRTCRRKTGPREAETDSSDLTSKARRSKILGNIRNERPNRYCNLNGTSRRRSLVIMQKLERGGSQLPPPPETARINIFKND